MSSTLKKSFISVVKDIVVDYFVNLLLIITVVGGIIFGANYFWELKKDEAVQAAKSKVVTVKTATSDLYIAARDSNTTKAVKTSFLGAITRASTILNHHTQEKDNK